MSNSHSLRCHLKIYIFHRDPDRSFARTDKRGTNLKLASENLSQRRLVKAKCTDTSSICRHHVAAPSLVNFTLPITSEQMVRFSICKRHLTPVYNRIYATKPFFPKKLAETRFLKFFSYFREQFQKCGLIARWRHASRIQRRVKHANRINRSDGK